MRIVIIMAQHALLSASSASRWMACPPSARLEENYENNSSAAAAEGTLAHELGELKLKKELGEISTRKYNIEFKKIQDNVLFTNDMPDYVDVYVETCMEKVAEARATTPDAKYSIEQRLNFTRWVPQGFGTGDMVIIGDGSIEIIDLKYGKGIPVSAIDNKQMRLYALGAIAAFSFLYEIENVKMTIAQPRLDSISTEEISATDLMAWAEEFVKPAADQAFRGEGEYCSGQHCVFCRAKAVCRTRAEDAMDLAKFEFAAYPTLTTEEIGEVLGKVDNLAKWAKDVQKYALDQALSGIDYKGWKLVEGKSNRRYTDADMVANVLLENKYLEDIIYKPLELQGISNMEKNIGKKIFNELLNDYIEKPQGKPTLVIETDKREEFNSIKSDFEAVEENITYITDFIK